MIPDETVERVRETADIVGVIGEYVQLKRTGADFRGPCPFHQGTGRNFSVSPKIGRYHCFVCHESGDVFSYLMKRIGVDFVTAVKMVGEKSGIDVVDVSSAHSDEKDFREPLWEVNSAAAEYFRRMLWDDDLGSTARGYVEKREVGRELAEKIGLGFAPREVGLMRTHLNTLGFDDARLVEAGLLHTPEGASEPRPRFRDRLIFPIYDVSNRVAGFGGRLLGPGEPKYLNSAESPVFSKGKLLYGLNWAKLAARRDERMLVVEGFFDVVRLIGAGIESVVAPMGTALTDEQAKLIRKYTNRAYLLYDADEAGQKATFRSGDELLRAGASVQVVTLPDGEDPDSFVRTYGAKGLEAQLAQSLDVFERKIQVLERGGWFSDLRKKRKALDGLLPTLRATADPITRDLYLDHAQRVTGVSVEVLKSEMRVAAQLTARSAPFQPLALRELDDNRSRVQMRGPRAPVRYSQASGMQLTEREFVRVLLHRPAEIEAILERVGPSDFANPLLRQIFSSILSSNGDTAVLANGLDEDAAPILQELLQESEGLSRTGEVIRGTLTQFREKDLNEELADLQRQLTIARDAEKDQLIDVIKRLNRERQTLGGRRWNTGAVSAFGDGELH
ncbi:MAG: DNA primase [bacterium]